MKKLNPFKLYQDVKFEFLALMSVPWVPEVLSRHAFVRCRERPKADQPAGGRQRAAKAAREPLVKSALIYRAGWT